MQTCTLPHVSGLFHAHPPPPSPPARGPSPSALRGRVGSRRCAGRRRRRASSGAPRGRRESAAWPERGRSLEDCPKKTRDVIEPGLELVGSQARALFCQPALTRTQAGSSILTKRAKIGNILGQIVKKKNGRRRRSLNSFNEYFCLLNLV